MTAAQDEPGASDPDAASGRGRVLVVEDDPGTLRCVGLALVRAGFEVESATNAPDAPDAVTVLSAVRPEVLLADIGLPGMSGFELIREARRLAPELAIALMTADASVDVQRARTRPRHVSERVLAVGAQPDDVEIGVGGNLVGHRR